MRSDGLRLLAGRGHIHVCNVQGGDALQSQPMGGREWGSLTNQRQEVRPRLHSDIYLHPMMVFASTPLVCRSEKEIENSLIVAFRYKRYDSKLVSKGLQCCICCVLSPVPWLGWPVTSSPLRLVLSRLRLSSVQHQSSYLISQDHERIVILHGNL